MTKRFTYRHVNDMDNGLRPIFSKVFSARVLAGKTVAQAGSMLFVRRRFGNSIGTMHDVYRFKCVVEFMIKTNPSPKNMQQIRLKYQAEALIAGHLDAVHT